ncbi:hypothetical protein E2C01_102060 [Portunus trituberculatus]|uniref:Uncharacterized protein n=1 Tax=Portunus trituberculatus TaxID=210409 RepID=A0A5B7KHK0_PORTR|nr:hypothetical protein [Portunus trituberculatus]
MPVIHAKRCVISLITPARWYDCWLSDVRQSERRADTLLQDEGYRIHDLPIASLAQWNQAQ